MHLAKYDSQDQNLEKGPKKQYGETMPERIE